MSSDVSQNGTLVPTCVVPTRSDCTSDSQIDTALSAIFDSTADAIFADARRAASAEYIRAKHEKQLELQSRRLKELARLQSNQDDRKIVKTLKKRAANHASAVATRKKHGITVKVLEEAIREKDRHARLVAQAYLDLKKRFDCVSQKPNQRLPTMQVSPQSHDVYWSSHCNCMQQNVASLGHGHLGVKPNEIGEKHCEMSHVQPLQQSESLPKQDEMLPVTGPCVQMESLQPVWCSNSPKVFQVRVPFADSVDFNSSNRPGFASHSLQAGSAQAPHSCRPEQRRVLATQVPDVGEWGRGASGGTSYLSFSVPCNPCHCRFEACETSKIGHVDSSPVPGLASVPDFDSDQLQHHLPASGTQDSSESRRLVRDCQNVLRSVTNLSEDIDVEEILVADENKRVRFGRSRSDETQGEQKYDGILLETIDADSINMYLNDTQCNERQCQ